LRPNFRNESRAERLIATRCPAANPAGMDR